MVHSKSKDNNILAEMYSGMSSASAELLLEMVPSKANIERFVKKYKLDYDDEITGQAHTPEAAARIARRYIDDWTPGLQQKIKALGGNPDIFAYPDIRSLYSMIYRAHSTASRSQLRQEVKLSQKDIHIPLVYETDTYAVFEPKTWEASRKYFGYPERESLLDGEKKEGARWCTAASREANGPGHFNRYVHTHKDRLLYIISKPADEMFAYRGRNPAPDGFSDWILRLNKKDIVSTIKLYKMLPEGSRKENYKTMLSTDIRDESYVVGHEYVQELRDGNNALINNLWFLFRDIHAGTQNYIAINEADKAMDFLKFVAFVVYGKTELVGLQQSTPDSELASIVKKEEEKIKNATKNTKIEPNPYTDEYEEDDFDFGDIADEHDDEPLQYEERYSPSKEELRLEAYKLLLETPATKANIERFIQVYYKAAIDQLINVSRAGGLSEDQINRIRDMNINGIQASVRADLEAWTPKVQRVLQARGQNPDIFSYPDLEAMREARANASISESDLKKAYKNADVSKIKKLWETDTYIAYTPLTWEASRKYFGISRESLLDGQQKEGSRWCTAADDRGLKFNEYINVHSTRLFYFVRKRDDALFAARSRDLTFLNKKKIKTDVVKTFNAYLQLYKPDNATPSSIGSLKDTMTSIFHFVNSMIYAGFTNWPLIECRGQKNNNLSLDKLFYELAGKSISDPAEYIEKFEEFMLTILLGKTR